MKVKFIIGLLLFSLPFFGFSQGEFNIWHFGTHLSMNFNGGSPVYVPGSAISSASVSVNVSDSLGNILFYSDGAKVWDRTNLVMPGGGNLGGYPGSYPQTVTVLKDIADSTKYFLFTCGYKTTWPTPVSARYSIIDMTLRGGLGDVDPAHRNIGLRGALSACGAITGTRHRNNKDAWIVIRLNDTDSNYYASYKVTSAGVDTVPVFSPSLMSIPTTPSSEWPLEIKISYDGSRLACTFFNDTIEICDFNTQTGQVSPRFKISLPTGQTSIQSEFDRKGDLLYVPAGPGGNQGTLYQMDMTSPDSASFMSSIVPVGSNIFANALQIGPDGKIYGTMDTQPWLYVVNNPEVPGVGCNFVLNGFNLLAANCHADGLPQFIQKYKAYVHHIGNCPNKNISFTSDIWPPADSIRWNFGDPTSGGLNFSTLATPSHNYSTSGNYTVELYVRHNDNRTDTTWQIVNILPSPQPTLGPDKTVCAGDSVMLDAGFCIGCTYVWDNLTTSQMNISTLQTYWAKISGDYRVTVTNTDGCSGKDTVHVTVNPFPDVTNNPLSKTICTGESTNIALTSTVPGTNFHWTASLTSGTVTGFSADSGLVINQVLTNPLATAGMVTYHITPKIGSCAGTAVDYQVTVNPGDSVKVTIVPSANNVCAGTSVTFTATPTNGGANPSYQWKVNGGNVGTNSPVFTYVPTNGNLVTCLLTSSNTVCTYNNPATSNSLLMVVNSPLLVSVSVSASANNVCAGTSVTFTATPTNPGTTPVYQWKVNGGNVGTNNPIYSYAPVNGDNVTCVLTSSETCTSGNPATSNTVTMIINPKLPVSVSVSASANPVCTGTSVTFTATPTNGGNTPSYQWKVNGGNVGTNNPVYTYTPANGDNITCILTSSETCTLGNPATSSPVVMTVNPLLPVSISISASQNPFCIGASVNFTATPSNGGATPSYQWKVNGVNTGTNSPAFSYNPVSGDQVTCVITSSLPCTSGNPATSNTITMIGNMGLPAGVSIAANPNPFCPGSSVTFTATPSNGGAGPSYQWKVNGVNAGVNSPTYTYNPLDGDSIRCVMTSNLPCVSGNPASSNKIILSGTLAPPVTFTACFDTITTTNAKPIKLKGGIPLGGTYSGTGVSGGYYYPNIAGAGIHMITYSYTNVSLCTASSNSRIHQFTSSPFTCGNILIDIRDGKSYPTVQIGTQCWFAEDLDYGSEILFTQNQRDNCIAEKYSVHPSPLTAHSFYQWDELMRYDETPANQGLCPPGWHIPTENEWNTLFTNWVNNAFAGAPLKYSGYSGFNALLNGAGHLNVQWDYAGFATFFWSSTSHGPYKAWAHAMNDFDPSVAYYPSSRINAFSVRCLKD